MYSIHRTIALALAIALSSLHAYCQIPGSSQKSASFDSISIGRTIKVGFESIYISAYNSNVNSIFTSGGPLRINPPSVIPPFVQNTLINENGGRIGLGTDDPKELVQIGAEWTFHNGGNKIMARNFDYDSPNQIGKRIVSGPVSAIIFGQNGDLVLSTAPNGNAGSTFSLEHRVRILNDGRVGIHNSNPKGDFQVDVMDSNPSRYGIVVAVQADDQHAFSVVNRNQTSSSCPNGEDVFRIKGSGLVEAKEICLFTSGWCDFVFAPDYPLLPLQDLAVYIQQKGHLPGVPSESEVLEEGQRLGEMNKALLLKVEELTLYTLQQQEQIDLLKEELKAIREELK